MRVTSRRPSWMTIAALAGLSTLALANKPRPDERKRKIGAPSPAKVYDFSADSVSGDLSATAGGAKDITFFRDRVGTGEIPHPNVFTPEGLLSEHDLPLKAGKGCTKLFCAIGEAGEAGLIAQPEVRWLAQLGFESSLSDATFKRAPLNLIAVIDKSGSMSGQPLELVKDSLRQVVAAHLKPGDRLGIVLYGDRSHVHLAPTPIEKRADIDASIDAIESAGSTAMEEGLKVGFDLARSSSKDFKGTTRVMLFTDERPNVGATDAGSFMGMAEAASKAGIGMTTIGVGVQFGAELATKIAGVRGGNLYFFGDLGKMKQTFKDDFDTFVTELAYDLELVVTPAPGLKIAGVYGIPNNLLEWMPGTTGAIKLQVKTIFLSRRAGGIFVGLTPAGPSNLPVAKPTVGKSMAQVGLSFTPRGKPRTTGAADLVLVAQEKRSLGLVRGSLLVDEATSLKAATTLHHEKNDQEGAYRIIHALAGLLRSNNDADLANERKLIFDLERTLAKLSGHQGEPAPVKAPSVDPVSSLPPRP